MAPRHPPIELRAGTQLLPSVQQRCKLAIPRRTGCHVGDCLFSADSAPPQGPIPSGHPQHKMQPESCMSWYSVRDLFRARSGRGRAPDAIVQPCGTQASAYQRSRGQDSGTTQPDLKRLPAIPATAFPLRRRTAAGQKTRCRDARPSDARIERGAERHPTCCLSRNKRVWRCRRASCPAPSRLPPPCPAAGAPLLSNDAPPRRRPLRQLRRRYDPASRRHRATAEARPEQPAKHLRLHCRRQPLNK
mmetsp:Transcript_86700/g.280141  ORF Transcript_86700/g.280141 Transcript_86700/m.280141 type:complete len:246 (-) Transcript_86700:1835-2572(-)